MTDRKKTQTKDHSGHLVAGGQTKDHSRRLAAGGQTKSAGGQTRSAGGQTKSAGGQTKSSGDQTKSAGGQWGLYDDQGDAAADTWDALVDSFLYKFEPDLKRKWEQDEYRKKGRGKTYDEKDAYIKENLEKVLVFAADTLKTEPNYSELALQILARALRCGRFSGLLEQMPLHNNTGQEVQSQTDSDACQRFRVPLSLQRAALEQIRNERLPERMNEWSDRPDRLAALDDEERRIRSLSPLVYRNGGSTAVSATRFPCTCCRPLLFDQR